MYDLFIYRDHKRLNVAITRAKKHLALVCDTETVTVHQQIREFLQYIKKNGTWKRPKPIDVNKAVLKGPRHQGNNFLPIAQLTQYNAVIEHIDRSKVVGEDERNQYSYLCTLQIYRHRL